MVTRRLGRCSVAWTMPDTGGQFPPFRICSAMIAAGVSLFARFCRRHRICCWGSTARVRRAVLTSRLSGIHSSNGVQHPLVVVCTDSRATLQVQTRRTEIVQPLVDLSMGSSIPKYTRGKRALTCVTRCRWYILPSASDNRNYDALASLATYNGVLVCKLKLDISLLFFFHITRHPKRRRGHVVC